MFGSWNTIDALWLSSYNTIMNEATIPAEATVTVGVRDLKNQLSHYLDRVKAGAEVIVTLHGTPIARLSAVGDEVDRRHALIAAGIVVPAQRVRRRLPKHRVEMSPGPSITDLVDEQRR